MTSYPSSGFGGMAAALSCFLTNIGNLRFCSRKTVLALDLSLEMSLARLSRWFRSRNSPLRP